MRNDFVAFVESELMPYIGLIAIGLLVQIFASSWSDVAKIEFILAAWAVGMLASIRRRQFRILEELNGLRTR